MKYTSKMNAYYDLKEANMKKRNLVNNSIKSMMRGIQTITIGEFEL